MNDLKYLTNYISVRYEVSKYCAKNILSLAGNRDICIDFIHKNIPMKKWYSENYATDIYNNIISSSELEPFTIKLAELEKADRISELINIENSKLDELEHERMIKQLNARISLTERISKYYNIMMLDSLMFLQYAEMKVTNFVIISLAISIFQKMKFQL